jgi:hypothetical protein
MALGKEIDMRRLAHAVVVLTCLVVVPSSSFAQSSITGVVRDTSGAVLPGVSVEASSDVLIEKVRSAVTDETGQYRITELRPGTYTVTFTLTGFSTVKREQLELPADFVSTVNADLRVGTLEETVTVTGESPIVDVQSARRRRTLDENLIESLPTAQGYAAVMVLMPSMIQSGGGNNNVLLNPGMIVFGGPRRTRQRRHRADRWDRHGRRHQRRRRLGLWPARHDRGGRADCQWRPR